ncbi:hypothetical protein [Nitrosophilus labii]|uniref:hypothetical protein n=1 Tax=Nitrosophilus labii TaxID=2706014 RepID=UPI0016571AA5|nr:hypothetical protein [Nitrosophilus labii]
MKKVKVQATITGMAADIYKLLPSMSKSKAITQAIILLAKDKNLREIFFDDLEELDAVLQGKKTIETKKKDDKQKEDKNKKNTNDKDDVEYGW